MLQTIFIAVSALVVASLLTAQGRLLRGAAVEDVVIQVRASLGLAAVSLAVVATSYALASDATLGRGLGLLSVGLSPEPVRRLALIRKLLLCAGGAALAIALAVWRMPVGHRRFIAATEDLGRLLASIRADVRACLTAPGLQGVWSSALFGLLVLGAVVRGYRASLPMAPDESITVVWFASRSPLDIISDYTIPNNHILHSLLVKLSHTLFGINELATRVPALIAGSALVAVVAWLAYKLFGAGTAIAGAALAAAAPPLLEYSAQARGYTLSALFLALAMVFLLYGQEDPKTRSPWVIYASCIAAALLTIPSSMMGVYFLGFWFLATYERRATGLLRPLGWTAAAGMAAALLYLPAAVRSGWRSIVANPYVASLSWSATLRRLVELGNELKACWLGALPTWAAALLALAALWGVGRRGRGPHRGVAMLLGLAATLTFLVVVNRVVPPTRTLLTLFPFVVVVAAAGIDAALAPFAARAPRLHPLVLVTLAVGWITLLEVRVHQRAGRPNIARWNDAGDDASRCCTEGYYPDAKAVAAFAKRVTSVRAPVAMQAFEGGSEAVRFYALALGVPMARIHRFDFRMGVGQIADYDSVFVVSRGAPRDTSALAHAAAILRVPVEELRTFASARFIAPEAPGSTFEVLMILPSSRTILTAHRRPFDVFEYPRAN